MTDPIDWNDDLEVIASAYIAGLLSDEEMRSFDAQLAIEPALRLALKAARERLLEFDVSVEPAQPSGELWSRIEQSLGSQPNVESLAQRRGDMAKIKADAGARNRGFWRGFAAASVAAAVLAGGAWTTLRPTHPRLVVVLLDSEARPVSIVETFDGQRIRIVPLDDIAVPPGRTLQVWTLPDPATGPVSMGLLPAVTATTLQGPTLPNPQHNQLYEITLEPSGGSPTGRPTGPIIGKGFAKVPQI